MAQTDTSTRKFTDMSVAQLRASMAQFEGLCVVATVNPDGTARRSCLCPRNAR